MRIGLDLGGTKIEAAALDEAGELRARRRVPTPKDYDELLAAIASLVAAVEADVGGGRSIGLCTPGARSPATGLWKNAHHTALQGKPVDADLARLLGREVRLANDAHCFALSEAADGSARDGKVVFGAILGTGVGGGLVVNGALVEGRNAVGGEWGHNPLPWPVGAAEQRAVCGCGREGCIEAYLSGGALARDHREVTGLDLPSEKIADLAASGEPRAKATMDRYCERLARALATVINLIDPDVIVLGGGVSGVARLYDTVPELWGKWVLSDVVETKLVKNQHGDSSGIRGAAWLWPKP
jgi:predicted NBD/HSP70 family sugar kinase